MRQLCLGSSMGRLNYTTRSTALRYVLRTSLYLQIVVTNHLARRIVLASGITLIQQRRVDSAIFDIKGGHVVGGDCVFTFTRHRSSVQVRVSGR